MRILLHICCANCALVPVTGLREKGIDVRGYWYNPNIHPEEEYTKRLLALHELQAAWGIDITYRGEYALGDFVRELSGETKDGERCEVCYRLRMQGAAEEAKRTKADAFSATLLYSPYQKHELLVEAAVRAEADHKVPFYYEDWRPGYRRGVELSREMGLYRQNYCGCVYSEAERRRSAVK